MAPTISGDADERFEPVRSALATNFDEDAELGASAAVVHRDVSSVTSGVDRRRSTDRPWESDTIVNLWSTTKTVAALVVLLLHDRGVLSVDDPIAVHWPEFAAAGKDDVASAALTHLAGLHEFRPPLEHETMFDWDESASFGRAAADSTPGRRLRTTPSPRGSCSARSYAGSRGRRWGTGSALSSPNRTTSTSTWAFPSRSGRGLPKSTTPQCRHRTTVPTVWPTSTRSRWQASSFPRRTATATPLGRAAAQPPHPPPGHRSGPTRRGCT